MKIAFLTPEYPHALTGSSGGIGSSIKNLALGLLAEGCSVRILVYGQKNEASFDDNGICIQQIKNIKVKGLSWYLTQKKLEKILNNLYKEQKIDLVEVPDWTGISSFIRPKKCPVLIRLNGSDTYFCHLDQRPVKWINKFYEKRAIQKADGLLSVSQFTAKMTNHVFGLNKSFAIVPNGIDTDFFRGNLEETNTINSNSGYQLLPNAAGNTILYFGSLIRKKGVLELPFIFNEIILANPNAHLLIVGKDVPDILSDNSSTWAMMQKMFSAAAFARVQYLGAIPYDSIKAQIKMANVCVFPSFAEALPVSWIEAMAMEKAIVASNIGWATEVIEDKIDGFLVHPKQHKAFAFSVLELLKDTNLQRKMGEAARKKVLKKFSISVVAKQILKVYEKVIYTKSNS